MPIRKRSFYRPRNEKIHLTKALVLAMAPDQSEYHVKDTGLPGLILKVTPAGKKSYLVRYRATDGAQRKFKIGKNANDMTPAAARLEAASVLQRVAKGEDPAEDRFNQRHGITFEAFQERFLIDFAEVHLAPKTIREYRRLLAKLIVPSLGNKKLTSINRSDISTLQRSLRDTPVQANHALRLVRRIYNYAEDQGVIPRGTNPAVRFHEFKEEPKERLVTSEELQRIGIAIRELSRERPASVSGYNAILFILHTACRVSEALNLKWEHIDFERQVLTFHDAKGGSRRHFIDANLEKLLHSFSSARYSDWVFPGITPDKRRYDLAKPWKAVLQRADIEHARRHDLRHTVLSNVAAISDIQTTAHIAGHKSLRATMRYLHANPAHTRSVAGRLNSTMGKLLFDDDDEAPER